jgi:hypothetical protein
MCPKIPPTYLI